MEEVSAQLERKFSMVAQQAAQLFMQLERSYSRAAEEKQRGITHRMHQLEQARTQAQETTAQYADDRWWKEKTAHGTHKQLGK